MLINKDFLKKPFVASNIGPIFHDVIMADKAEGLNLANCSNEVMNFWKRLETYLKEQPYYNLEQILETMNRIPYSCRNSYRYEATIVAMLTQRFGPSQGANKYFTYSLGTSLGLTSGFTDLVEKLRRIRFELAKPSMQPESVMYDMNWLKLAVPFKQFIANLIKAQTQFKDIPEDLMIKRRIKIFKFFLSRKSVYATVEIANEFDKVAMENMERYLDTIREIAPEMLEENEAAVSSK